MDSKVDNDPGRGFYDHLRCGMRRFCLSITLALLTLSAIADDPAGTNRPASWAQPVNISGVPNLYKVTDTIYRSAQPTAEGMQNLKAMGIKTIIDLRAFHSDHDELGNTGLVCVSIPMHTWH